MKKYLYFFSFILLIFSSLLGQTVNINDGSTNTLLQIVDEGSAGSLKLPNVGTTIDDIKLYNNGGNLYWGLNQIGFAGSAGGWTHNGTSIYNTTLTDKVGIGVNNPTRPLSFNNQYGDKISIWGPNSFGNILGFGNQPALFQMYTDGSHADIAFGYGQSSSFNENMRIKGNGKVGIGTTNPLSILTINSRNNWGSSVGDGWGDFSINDGTNGLAIGVATAGGGTGDIRFWAKGGTERIMFGNVTNGDVLTSKDGNIGIGTKNPSTKLDVAGQIKITGGSPGTGKVLTSDTDGLATWEENQIGFHANLKADITLASNTETQLTNFTEIFDDGNGFNPTTGVYTIVADGLYHFDIKVRWDILSGSVSDAPVFITFYKNNTFIERFFHRVTLNSYNQAHVIGYNIKLQTDDQISIKVQYVSSSSLNVDYGNGTIVHTYFSGFKVY